MSTQNNQPQRLETLGDVRNRFAAYVVLAIVALAFLAMVFAAILGGGPAEAPVDVPPLMP
jgi:hypothetical protein